MHKIVAKFRFLHNRRIVAMSQSKASANQSSVLGSLLRTSPLPLTFAVALGLASPAAQAVDAAPASAMMRMNFASPGARAAGMGGAFIGLSDDSSTAFLNPAGLLLLPNKEITLETRYRSPELPDAAWINKGGSSTKSSTDLSYASFAWPLPDRRIGLGFFYGQLSSFKGDMNATGGQQGTVTLDDTYYGASFAFQPTTSLRLGVSLQQMRRSLTDISSGVIGKDANDQDIRQYVVTHTRDDDWAYNLGMHWGINENWSLGLTYRSNSEFISERCWEVNTPCTTTFSNEELRTMDIGVPGSTGYDIRGGSTVIPSAIALGIGFRPSDRLTLALDIARINYSQQVSEADIPKLDVFFASSQLDWLKADDSTDVRLGLEYAIPAGDNIWFVRGGLARTGSPSLYASAATTDVGIHEFFPKYRRDTHTTVGVGFAGKKLGFDMAFDHGKYSGNELVASVTFGF
jgi:long-chain fatty acid transport protein